MVPYRFYPLTNPNQIVGLCYLFHNEQLLPAISIIFLPTTPDSYLHDKITLKNPYYFIRKITRRIPIWRITRRLENRALKPIIALILKIFLISFKYSYDINAYNYAHTIREYYNYQ